MITHAGICCWEWCNLIFCPPRGTRGAGGLDAFTGPPKVIFVRRQLGLCAICALKTKNPITEPSLHYWSRAYSRFISPRPSRKVGRDVIDLKKVAVYSSAPEARHENQIIATCHI